MGTESVNFKKLIAYGKKNNVTPVTVLVKTLGEAIGATETNMKLSDDKREMRHIYDSVDVGVAVDADGQLRVAVIRDVLNKSLGEIAGDITGFARKGAKLGLKDQDLTNVCWTVSSMGKNASEMVIPVLPKGTTGIAGVGRTDPETGKSKICFSICHATMTGMNGSEIANRFREIVDGL